MHLIHPEDAEAHLRDDLKVPEWHIDWRGAVTKEPSHGQPLRQLAQLGPKLELSIELGP